MSGWSCNQKVCTSCRYWCGRREIDFMACFFNALDVYGLCMGDVFRGIETSESSSCSSWEPFKK